MTPKEKALELVNKCSAVYNGIFTDKTIKELATHHALIAVDEIIEVINIISSTDSQYNYWKQVKQEIEKL